MRALVVCHDRRVRLEVARLLREWKFDVTEFRDGQQALELIEAGEDLDVMVAQLMLPFKDGWELCQVRNQRG